MGKMWELLGDGGEEYVEMGDGLTVPQEMTEMMIEADVNGDNQVICSVEAGGV